MFKGIIEIQESSRVKANEYCAKRYWQYYNNVAQVRHFDVAATLQHYATSLLQHLLDISATLQ